MRRLVVSAVTLGVLVAMAAQDGLASAPPRDGSNRREEAGTSTNSSAHVDGERAYTHRVFMHRYGDGARARVHLVTIDLCHAGVSLRATSPREGASTVRRWARTVGAAIAVNGDFFDSPGPRPLGPSRGAGLDWPARPAFYYDAVLAMRPDAPPTIFARPPDAASWPDMIGTQEVIVNQGLPRLSPDVVHSRNRHPRSALGMSRDRRTLLIALVEGRVPGSVGATTRELGELMQSLGAWTAIRLDGGGSSTLFVRGHGIVNRPADGHERVVANHVGVMLDEGPNASRPSWCDAAP